MIPIGGTLGGVTVDLTCGSGAVAPGLWVTQTNSMVSFNCGFAIPPASSLGCQSMYDTLKRIDRFENPGDDGTCGSYVFDFSVEPNRELFVRDFAAQHATHQYEAELMYSWLLGASPPDQTVVQNLDAGQSLESQIVAIVGGDQFFAQANYDNGTFVTHAYWAMFLREPAQWERDSAVQELNGYWVWVEDPTCYDVLPPIGEPPPPCNAYWEWHQITRSDFGWEMVMSHEFHQAAAKTLLYHVQLRRDATSTEVENLAYYMDSTGSVLEGAVAALRSAEFYEKSIQVW